MSIRTNPSDYADAIFDRALKAEREGKVQKAYRLYEHAVYEYKSAGRYEASAYSDTQAQRVLEGA